MSFTRQNQCLLPKSSLASWVPPGASWVPFWCLLRASWMPPGVSWVPSWCLLGASWVHPGCLLVPSWCLPGCLPGLPRRMIKNRNHCLGFHAGVIYTYISIQIGWMDGWMILWMDGWICSIQYSPNSDCSMVFFICAGVEPPWIVIISR